MEGRVELEVASPKGGVAPLDPYSLGSAYDAESQHFLKNKRSIWENTQPIRNYLGRAKEFAAVFYAGGQGPMMDLVGDGDSIKLINEFYAAGNIVAAVCHGPIAFVHAETPEGRPLVEGRRVTGYTNAEETRDATDKYLSFLLETEFVALGAKFIAARPSSTNVVVDGQLITGQNPESAGAVGEAICEALGV